MFNLLRMDLYRMKRSKFIYVCFCFLLFAIMICYATIYLIFTPKGREIGSKIGMTITERESSEDGMTLTVIAQGDEVNNELSAELENMTLLDMYRESNMDGGMYNVVYGIAVALLICGDYNGGFVKNIMALHRERWPYIGSKLMAAGILDFLYLVLSFVFNMLMNLLFGNLVQAAPWSNVAFYLAWAWVVSMGFAALIILLCVASRSTTVGVTGSVILGSGLLVMLLYSLTSQFNLGGWLEYTLYYNISYGPSVYTSIADLRAAAVGLVFLVIYSIAAGISLIKRDI